MWNKTEHNGRVCYEKSNGTRVFSTQEVEALNNLEKYQTPSDDFHCYSDFHYCPDDEEREDVEPMHPVTLIILLVMILSFAIAGLSNI